MSLSLDIFECIMANVLVSADSCEMEETPFFLPAMILVSNSHDITTHPHSVRIELVRSVDDNARNRILLNDPTKNILAKRAERTLDEQHAFKWSTKVCAQRRFYGLSTSGTMQGSWNAVHFEPNRSVQEYLGVCASTCLCLTSLNRHQPCAVRDLPILALRRSVHG